MTKSVSNYYLIFKGGALVTLIFKSDVQYMVLFPKNTCKKPHWDIGEKLKYKANSR